MTNATIIFNHSMSLMEEGKIGNTGKKITLQMADGSKVETFEPEPIHTYQTWKALGYQVQKGQKAIAQFTIWVPSKKKQAVDEDPTERKTQMYMKLSSFFSASQVQKIA